MRLDLVLILVLITSQPTFCVYYGNVGPKEVEQLNKFDLLILSPLIEPKYLSQIHAIKLGYISLTTVSEDFWEPWVDPRTVQGISIGGYEEWGEYYVNVSDPRWEAVIIDRAVPYLLNKGFDGVFLDNLDAVDWYASNLPNKAQGLKQSVIEIVHKIRAKYPKILILVNRGFSIIDEIAPYIDGILFESFGTYYNFHEKKYMKFAGNDLEWIRAQYLRIESLAKNYGWKYVLLLGYADPKNSTMITDHYEFMKKLDGERPIYIADKYLSKIVVFQSPEKEGERFLTRFGGKLTIWTYFLLIILALLGMLSLRLLNFNRIKKYK